MIKHAHLLPIAGGIVAIAALCLAGTSPEPCEESSEIEQIKKEVASLRQRVDSLERQLKEHGMITPENHTKEPSIIHPRPYPRHVPKDWKPFEFNGMTFYVVPIGNKEPAGNEQDK